MVIAFDCAELVPQLFVAVTVRLPAPVAVKSTDVVLELAVPVPV